MRGSVPPNPVAKPIVPSVASISTQNDPRTLIPQLVLEVRYFSHLDIGVEIGESISLPRMSASAVTGAGCLLGRIPMAALDIVIIASGTDAIDHVGPDGLDLWEVASRGGRRHPGGLGCGEFN